MKGRIIAGTLALALGSFGAQKFYLGQRIEGILCILFIWTGIPTLLGVFEGIRFFACNENQWGEYLKALNNTDWYKKSVITKSYLYPISIVAFALGMFQNEYLVLSLLCFVPLIAIWLYPGSNEVIFMNRFGNISRYPIRIITTIIFGYFAFFGAFKIYIPKVEILSPINTTQTGGLYQFRVSISPAEKVLIDGKPVEKNQNGVYETQIELVNPENRVHLKMENKERISEKTISIFRAINNQELSTQKGNQNENAESTIHSALGIQNMTQDEKKKLYWEYIYAQRTAEAETLEKYPVKKQMENIQEYVQYSEQNREKYYREVARKDNLSYEDLILIVNEANAKMWEMPPK